MGNYWDVRRSSSNCVHFVFDGKLTEEEELVTELRASHVRWHYVDYLSCKFRKEAVIDAIGRTAGLRNAPYHTDEEGGPRNVWLEFLDDLMSLAEESENLVIIIDNADAFLQDERETMFRLVETFLTQIEDWLREDKPCHLCFQMQRTERLRRIFSED
jgi:hypothetical protein